MDPLQRPVHAVAQVLAAYLTCLPARVSTGLAHRSSSPTGAALTDAGRGGAGDCEPVREVLRALGAVFHLEFAGHAALLDEAAWRSLLIACGRVGGPGMRRLAVTRKERPMARTETPGRLVSLRIRACRCAWRRP
jgi:hypothetical protein